MTREETGEERKGEERRGEGKGLGVEESRGEERGTYSGVILADKILFPNIS